MTACGQEASPASGVPITSVPYSNDSNVVDSTRKCATDPQFTYSIDNRSNVSSPVVDAYIAELTLTFPKISCYLKDNVIPESMHISIQLREFLDTERAFAALTSGHTISINAEYIRKVGTGDAGMLTHELVHVLQGYRSVPGWITEGMADYLRYLYTPANSTWRLTPPNPATDRPTSGYRTTARFFLWIEKKVRPGFMRQLSLDAASGRYTGTYFEVKLGQSLEALWDQYLAAPEL